MTALKLKGRQISNINRLRDHFSAGDVLRRREAFASFAAAHLKLNAYSRYYADMFQAALSDDQENAEYRNDFWDNPYKLVYSDVEDDYLAYDPAREDDSAKAEARETVRRLFLIAGRTSLPDVDKLRLFRLLASAYLLVEATIDDYPITPEEAESAFRGDLVAPESVVSKTEFVIPERQDEPCLLPARQEEYRARAWPDGMPLGEDRIRTIKIVAGRPPLSNGSSELRVTLAAYHDDRDTPAETWTLAPGEYIYLNVAGGRIIGSPCMTVDNASQRKVARRYLDRGELYIHEDGAYTRLPWADCRNPSSCALERHGMSGLFIQDHRLYTGHFSLREMFPILSKLENIAVVEVTIADGEFAVLQDDGRVYSSNDAWNGLRHVARLGDINS